MFELEKLGDRVEELNSFRFVDMINIDEYTAMEASDENAPITLVPKNIKGKTLKIGDFFIGADKYLWAEKNVTLPNSKNGFKVAGVFDFGKTGGGHNSGFESLLYIDKIAFQGVDTNHKEVIFDGIEGKSVNLAFMLWTGLWGGGPKVEQIHKIKTSQIGYLHIITDELYYLGKSIVKTATLLEKTDTTREFLIDCLNGAFAIIDWDLDCFYNTVEKAYTFLKNELEKNKKASDITVHCVGHTHIDVCWLWRLKHTREKCGRSFATATKLMEQFDEFKFLQSQPQLYKFVKNDYPEIFEKIKANIKSGQWEADGGMWLEADCNLSSGESLSRQFLYGINFLKNEFDIKCEYLWLPDVFGYSWALPQIMKLCNIKTFMTTKISWNQFNPMPHDTFNWRGIDGTEMLTYFITTPDNPESTDFSDNFSTYNGQLTPNTLIGSWTKYKDKEVSKDILLSYGYGDGGGGVNREMLMMERAMDKTPGLPNIKMSKAGEFFNKLHENTEKNKRKLATWDGELYLEYHRGTYTTQAHNKKMNRMLENKLAEAEWLGVLGLIKGKEYNEEVLHNSWETVLRNQFHDIIPGSSIGEVYADTFIEYEDVNKNLEVLKQDTIKYLAINNENSYVLTNFSSFEREELVEIGEKSNVEFYDGQVLLESIKTEKGYLVKVKLEPMSIKNISFKEASNNEAKQKSLEFKKNEIETEFYLIKWNKEGQMERIFDKKNNREILHENQCGNVFEIFEDKPMRHDAWDIDIYYTEKMEVISCNKAPEIIESSNLRIVIRFNYTYKKSEIIQDVIVYHNSQRIDFKTKVDWHENHKLLKVAFNLDIRATKATYDIQYGYVERPTHFNTSWDYARFEVCAHKWADLSEQGYGVSLINDCKYGHSVKDNKMSLTLLKSSKAPDVSADMGKHEFCYALYPHKDGFVEGGTIAEALNFNTPVGCFKGELAEPKNKIFFVSQGNNIQIDAIKKCEHDNSVILRVHECFGQRGDVKIMSEFDLKSYEEVNILEEPICEAKHGKDSIEFFIKPFEIKTFKIKF